MLKKVLLVMPVFYGIEAKIREELEKQGFEVTWINNRMLPLDFKSKTSQLRLLRRLYYFFFRPKENYVNQELRRIRNRKFDILFCINCNIVCYYLFKRLRSENPALKSVLFLWDSLLRYSWEKEIAFFDKVFTFDRLDSEKFGLIYMPNFYLKQSENLENTCSNLVFIGKFSLERIKLLEKIGQQAKHNNLKYNFLLYPAHKKSLHNFLLYLILSRLNPGNGWSKDYITFYEAFEKKLKSDFIIYEPIDFEIAQKRFNCSNVVVDIPVEQQRGYTHRVIQALALGKKIITTNSAIKNEPFFNPDQIHIIDKYDPVIESSWIREKKIFQVDPYFEKLELSNWLKSFMAYGIA